MSKVMNLVRGFLGCQKTPTGSICFPPKAIEGLRRFSELVLIETHFIEGGKEKSFSLAAIIDEDFDDIPSIDRYGDDHDVCVGERG
jgi:hypothetical protein